jgi:regulator of PEP synthase PpsR (kinase-PPPase family)
MGRFHGLVDRASYDGRIDAMDYALDHDDGGNVSHYRDADVILVGVSRSGKTPTSVYLALQFGIRAANYPMTEEDLDVGHLPEVLAPHRERLFGLTIVPDRLRKIRSERRPNSRYASLSRCRKEVAEAESIFQRERVAYIDTSGSSIEEIASKIIQRTGLKRRSF